MIKYDPDKKTITLFYAQNISYQIAAEELDCSKDTILNRMKTLHQHDETHLELTENIDAILTEASNNEQFLSCKIIQNKLRINFNYEISLKKHYIGMRKLASYKYPASVPFLQDHHKESRVNYARLILNTNIENWIFSVNAAFSYFEISKRVRLEGEKSKELLNLMLFEKA